MISISRHDIAGLVFGSTLLMSSAAHAFIDVPPELNLPTDATHYYNPATGTAITLQCGVKICEMRAISNFAKIDMTQTYDFTLAFGGNIQASVGDISSNNWDEETSKADYKTAKENAVTYAWNADSEILAALYENAPEPVQGMIAKIYNDSADSVTISSTVPVSEGHGLQIFVVFNDASKTVEFYTLPVVNIDGNVDKDNAAPAVTRPYHLQDITHYNVLKGAANGQPDAFIKMDL